MGGEGSQQKESPTTEKNGLSVSLRPSLGRGKGNRIRKREEGGLRN